ncbi:copper chaperone PCu(A)C [Streptomyces sp. DSM 44917]|uniref:Copper chaperone PCu(A)C n=1 Tax=Streptomyces boetiae TaxID=3075541 RepID=A0ABU2LBP3_9ACTN|nr:copper chaperone PCu(A)C [Streptomyces sp. DSM 44917]MDT0309006.1 copper chaperone PCu(A)C [Streptomyces sp. DSM 44917]
MATATDAGPAAAPAPHAAAPGGPPGGGPARLAAAALAAPVLLLASAPRLAFTEKPWLCFVLAAQLAVWGAWPCYRRLAARAARAAREPDGGGPPAWADAAVAAAVAGPFGWAAFTLFLGPGPEAGQRAATGWLGVTAAAALLARAPAGPAPWTGAVAAVSAGFWAGAGARPWTAVASAALLLLAAARPGPGERRERRLALVLLAAVTAVALTGAGLLLPAAGFAVLSGAALAVLPGAPAPRVRAAACATVLAVLAGWAAIGAAGTPARPAVVQARVMVPLPGNETGTSAYFDLRNDGGADDELTEARPAPGDLPAETEAALSGPAPLPAGETLRMAPWTVNVLLEPAPPLRPGQRVRFTLEFRDSPSIEVTAVAFHPRDW